MRDSDRRGSSVTIGYVLNLSIATILLSGLIIAGGGLVENQTHRVTKDELTVIGHQVANDLASADRLARAGTSSEHSEVTIWTDLPSRTAAGTYSLTVNSTSRAIVLQTSDPKVRVTVPFRAETKVRNVIVDGGPIHVDLAGGELEVKST